MSIVESQRKENHEHAQISFNTDAPRLDGLPFHVINLGDALENPPWPPFFKRGNFCPWKVQRAPGSSINYRIIFWPLSLLKYRLLKTSRAPFLKPVQPIAPPRALQAGK
jgi:hypothetical protein